MKHSESRFDNVFTKLRVFGLIEYDKVVLLDTDMYVKANIDDLFYVAAPAAMARGLSKEYSHGDAIRGDFFFKGADGEGRRWSQCGGINAGVMVLRPNLNTLEHMLKSQHRRLVLCSCSSSNGSRIIQGI